ncbi:hypothetical protein BH24PSE1_BH24PSE1_04890 [soil metagenome]
MTVFQRKWIVPAASALLLLACDSGGSPAEDIQPAENAPAPSNVTDAPKRGGSIIREDVLAETDVPPPARIDAAEVTLDFAQAGGELPDAAATKLDALLKQPVIGQGGCVIIRAHTDSRGSDEQNVRVSERRARLVGDYLAENGVERERLRLIVLGERRPVAPNANADGTDFPEGRAKNRRVMVEAQLPAAEGGACNEAMVPRDGVEPPTP